MPAHIYMRLGRYEDSYKQNIKAVEVDEGYITSCNIQGVYPLGYYPRNIHFMVWSAMFEGRSAEALELARKVAGKIPDHVDERNWGSYELFRSQPYSTMVRFGMWEEILAEPRPTERAPYLTGIWHYARALAYMHRDNADRARSEWKALDAIANGIEAVPGDERRGDYPKLLTIASEIVQGEMSAKNGHPVEGRPHLERALRLQDSLPYTEPPVWYFPVRHVLGAMLIEAGYPDEAEVVYWTDLRQYPENGFALLGLEQSLRAQGKDEEAEDAAERFARAWARADVKLTTSRF